MRSAVARQGVRSVPFGLQIALAVYVLLTGEISSAPQGLLFGLSDGASAQFGLFLLTALTLDALRLAPLFMLARNPLGILHPLILMILVWPIINGLPFIDQQIGGLVGLFSGRRLEPPYYVTLPGRTAGELWMGMATYNGLQALGLVTAYGVFAVASRGRPAPQQPATVAPQADPRRVRVLLLAIIVAAVAGAVVFVMSRGGFDAHMHDLAGGRFGALAGLGPLISILDIGVVAALVWVVLWPRDVTNPVFIASVMALAAAQFLTNGSRGQALLVVVTIGLAWSLRTRRIPWRAALLAAPILLAAYGALTVARTSAWSGATASSALSQLDLQTALATAQTDTLARAAQRGAVPVIVDGFERSGGPLWGQTYVGGILAFVPRAVWPDKPRGPGSTYARLFVGAAREGTTIPIGAVGEAYWNFGIPGVVVAYAILGWAMRLALNLYLRRPTDPFVTAFYVLFTTQFGVQTEALVRFQQSMFLLLLVWSLYRLAGFGRSRAPHPMRARVAEREAALAAAARRRRLQARAAR